MKILVTGGAGFIGTQLIERIKDHQVVSVDNKAPGKKDSYTADVSDASTMNRIFANEEPEYVFHLAAHVNPRISMENPAIDVKANVIGTMNIVEMCRKYGVKKLIFPSTAAVYGEPGYIPVSEEDQTLPISVYGASKLVAEKYIRMYHNAYGIDYAILRYANVYGPGSRSVISTFTECLRQNKSPVIFGDGKQTRDYIYIDDVLTATVRSMEVKENILTNISTGTEVNTKEIWEMISSGSKSPKPKFVSEKKGEIKRMALDNSLAKKILKWKPETSIDDGIKKTLKASKI